MKKSIFIFVLLFCFCFCGCSVAEKPVEQSQVVDVSSNEVSQEASQVVTYLTGDEYDRINQLLQCNEDEYFEFTVSGQNVKYMFSNGYFSALLTIGNSQVKNEGGYKITKDTVELFFNNGTHQSWPYEVKNGELYLTNPN